MLEQIRPIAEKHGASLAQLVLNWTMQRPGVGCVLAGARNAAQVKDNAGALGFSLSPEELEAITAVSDAFIPPEPKTA